MYSCLAALVVCAFGIGSGVLTGTWSRRISEEHRLVYLVDGDDIVILQARYHYG